MTPPRAPRHVVELLPITFVPGRHVIPYLSHSRHWMLAASRRFTGGSFCASFRNARPMPELFIYISDSSVKHFPLLLYQTRYGEICFERGSLETGREFLPQGADGNVPPPISLETVSCIGTQK